jgi:predicted homoserine dehydrogenase-like protein
MATWQRWADSRRQAAVAVVGTGFIGRGTVHRLTRVSGMRTALIVARSIENGLLAYKAARLSPDEVVVSDDPDELEKAVASRTPALSSSPDVVNGIDGIDVVVEATGALDYGAKVVLGAIESRKHVISMNAELDATIGSLLHHRAGQSGVVYTISDGDQPGVMLRQIEFVSGMGFDITAAINCKRNLDVYQNPDVSRGYANRDKTSLAMTTAFGDGTKMQIENAVVANATGLVPDRRGMHGVETTLERACNDIMRVLSRRGVVDYTLGGDFGGGMGVIGYADDSEMVQPYMRYSKMGDGPDYFFFRPYHLLHFELPLTIAEVILDGQGLGGRVVTPVAEVLAIAKRDLLPGEMLDGIGGFTCYGHIDMVRDAEGMLPIGLAEHARLKRRVAQDEPIAMDDVEVDEEAEIVRLRDVQDRTLSLDAS